MAFLLSICAGTISFAQNLPEIITDELHLASISEEAVGIVIQSLDGSEPLISHNADVAFHPASIMKVVTTYAALELLGPHFRWKTDAYVTGKLENGVLDGNLIIKGSGDPSFSLRDLWQFIRDIQDAGIYDIRGNIILDKSIFGQETYDSAAFDDAPLKPYNAIPDALLLNDKKIHIQFVSNSQDEEIEVMLEPRMEGIEIIPPVATHAACVNWQEDIIIHVDDRMARFDGEYSLSCGKRTLDIHPYQMSSLRYFESVFVKMWRESGGMFNGKVFEGVLPSDARFIARWTSPSLGVVVHAVNKYSNNVKARQLLLALGVPFHHKGVTTKDGIDAIRKWLAEKKIIANEMVIENGSGLSREEKIAPSTMAQILKVAYESSVMPELIASFPVVGRDGTMSRRLTDSGIAGKAHIKTGAIRDVRAIAGYVLAKNGQRYLVVCMVNHANAGLARPVLDSVLNWIYENG